jgi:hypothetical protein
MKKKVNEKKRVKNINVNPRVHIYNIYIYVFFNRFGAFEVGRLQL